MSTAVLSLVIPFLAVPLPGGAEERFTAIGVWADTGAIEGEGWVVSGVVTVELTANGSTRAWTLTTDGSGYFQIPDAGAVAGDVIDVTDGSVFKSMTVIDLDLHVDPNAGPDTAVVVTTSASEDLFVTARDGTGNEAMRVAPTPAHAGYTVDFTDATDADEYGQLTGGVVWAAANSNDADGDGTNVIWDASGGGDDGGGPPTVHASAYGFEYVEGVGWEGLDPVKIEIAGLACTASGTFELNGDEPGHFFYDAGQFGETCDLSPGDVVTVTSNGGDVTKTLTVTALVVTDVDADTDTIAGLADPGEVTVEVWTGEDEFAIEIPVTVDSDGAWSVSLAAHDVDLTPGGPEGAVHQWDDDGDASRSDWYVPEGAALHSGPAQDMLILETWPTGSDITVSVYASGARMTLLHSQTVPTHGPYFVLEQQWIDLGGFDLQAGHWVEATNGMVTRAYAVSPISVDTVDFASQTLFGTADPGAQLFAATENDTGSCEAGVTADTSGAWSVVFDQAAVDAGTVDCHGDPVLEFGTRVAGAAGEPAFVSDASQGVTIVFWNAEHTSAILGDGGGTASTGDEPTADHPVETSVTTTDGGEVTITEISVHGTVNDGFVLLGTQVTIETTITDPTESFVVTFVLDASVTPDDLSTIKVLKDGVAIRDCGTPEPACVHGRARDATTGDTTITVLTWGLGSWVLGVPVLQLGLLTAPSDPLAAPATVDVSVPYVDVLATDDERVVWTLTAAAGPLSVTGTADQAAGVAAGSFSDVPVGVYVVDVALTDTTTGAQAAVTFDGYVVVYDPDGGFVTGGGWIHSPAGAYPAEPDLEGKATFGFVSRYHRGADVPSGTTEFVFHAAGLEFHSSSYEWLVVAGPDKAKFKGGGTVNGELGYGFMLTATDGDPDAFRISIWDAATEEIVYDNHVSEPDDSYVGTELGGGSIVIHTDRR